MPNYENNNLFGTLYITFDVEFPKSEFSQADRDGKFFYLFIQVIPNLFTLDPFLKYQTHPLRIFKRPRNNIQESVQALLPSCNVVSSQRCGTNIFVA